MSDLEQIQHKLFTTPTAGVAGEHSAWARRLFSAGYKGHIQGAIGGASMYGAMGLLVGTVVGVPLAIATGGTGALLLIPIMSGIGVIHGAETFSHIGTTASIIAEDSEISERRRTLLDRYYDTSTGDAEKAEIQKQLNKTTAPKKPEKPFHWKTVMVGAAIGGAIALGITLLAITPAAAELLPWLGHVTEFLSEAAAHGGLGLTTTAVAATATAIGAAAGSLIGIDREYVRRWMDGAENFVAEPHHITHAAAERQHEISQITKAAKNDRLQVKAIPTERLAPPPAPAPAPITGNPTTHVSAVNLQNRMDETDQPIQVPSI